MPAFLLPIALAFLMFVVGLQLKLGHITDVFRRPVPLLIGLVAQVLLLPLFAVAIARILGLDAAASMGLMLLAISPGGITSNYVTLLARADVALSTAMTLMTSMAASFTIPLFLKLDILQVMAPLAGEISVVKTAALMTMVSAVPLACGMLLNALLADMAATTRKWLAAPSKMVFAGIVLATFIQNREALLSQFPTVGLACMLLNLAAIGTGLATSVLKTVTMFQARAIAIECGLQNAAVTIFLAQSVFGRPELSVAALVYAVIMNASSIAIIASTWRKKEVAA